MRSCRTFVAPMPAGHVKQPVTPVLLLWVAVGLLIPFVALAAAAHTTPYFPLDLQAARAVQAIPLPWFHASMMALSWFGFPPQAPIFLGLVVLGFVLARRWRDAAYLAVSGAGIAAIGQVVKMLVDR